MMYCCCCFYMPCLYIFYTLVACIPNFACLYLFIFSYILYIVSKILYVYLYENIYLKLYYKNQKQQQQQLHHTAEAHNVYVVQCAVCIWRFVRFVRIIIQKTHSLTFYVQLGQVELSIFLHIQVPTKYVLPTELK